MEKEKEIQKESFLIYKSAYPAIQELSITDKGLLLDAIFQYNLESIIPDDLPTNVKIIFLFMKSQFDRDNKKYEAICERNRLNIEKRWQDAKNTSGKSGNTENTKNTTGKSGILKNTKNTDTDTESENDSDSENDNDRILKKRV
jgi:hypothetical protein